MIKRKVIAGILIVLMLLGLVSGAGSVSQNAYAAGDIASGIEVGDHIYLGNKDASGYTGLPYWRVIDKDSDGYLFLMSEYLWTGSDADSFIPFNKDFGEEKPMEGYEDLGYKIHGSDFQESDAQKWCRGFEQEVLGNIGGLSIKPITKTDAEYESPDNDYDDPQDEKIFYAWKKDILKDDTVFFLSAEEAAHYMPTRQERVAYTHDGTSAGGKEAYWLRSPRLYTLSECAGQVLAFGDRTGKIKRAVVKTECAARPVFWAKFGDETCVKELGNGEWNVEATHIQDITYSWSSDFSECTATASATCSNCGHAIQEISETKKSVSTVRPASVTEDGLISYRVDFENELFEAQTKTVAIGKPYDPVTGITDESLPKVKISKPKGGKKSMTSKWKKLSKKDQKKIQGIEVQYAEDRTFAVNAVLKTAKKTKTSVKLKKLASKKTYWVRMRTYKTVNGFKYVGAWSKAKKVKTR